MSSYIIPTGILGINQTPPQPPLYETGWKMRYISSTYDNRYFVKNKSGDNLHIKFKICSNLEISDELLYIRCWNIANYILAHLNKDTTTDDCLELLVSAPADYHLLGDEAKFFGGNGWFGALKIDNLRVAAASELTVHRNQDRTSALHHIRVVINGTIESVLSFFNQRFYPHIRALGQELKNQDGSMERYESMARRMDPYFGGASAGVSLEELLLGHHLPPSANPERDIFFWHATKGYRIKHEDTLRYQNKNTLMFHMARDKILSIPKLIGISERIDTLVRKILGDGEGEVRCKIWKLGYEDQLSPCNITEVRWEDIKQECKGGGKSVGNDIYKFLAQQ